MFHARILDTHLEFLRARPFVFVSIFVPADMISRNICCPVCHVTLCNTTPDILSFCHVMRVIYLSAISSYKVNNGEGEEHIYFFISIYFIRIKSILKVIYLSAISSDRFYPPDTQIVPPDRARLPSGHYILHPPMNKHFLEEPNLVQKGIHCKILRPRMIWKCINLMSEGRVSK